jgi:hypothetical protein
MEKRRQAKGAALEVIQVKNSRFPQQDFSSKTPRRHWVQAGTTTVASWAFRPQFKNGLM